MSWVVAGAEILGCCRNFVHYENGPPDWEPADQVHKELAWYDGQEPDQVMTTKAAGPLEINVKPLRYQFRE